MRVAFGYNDKKNQNLRICRSDDFTDYIDSRHILFGPSTGSRSMEIPKSPARTTEPGKYYLDDNRYIEIVNNVDGLDYIPKRFHIIMTASIGWVIILLALILAKPGILAIVNEIEADDPMNPAVINGYHYPAAVFLYALIVSPLLVICSALSLMRKEPSRYFSLIYGVPAVGLLVYFIVFNHL